MQTKSGASYNRFYQVIDEIANLFVELRGFEEEKLQAIVQNDVGLLEKEMHEEQAYLLKMRGLDQKREKIQEEMGLGNLKFSQIIESAPREEQAQLETRRELLALRKKELQETVENSRRHIELHLQQIDRILSQHEQDNPTYARNGEKEIPKQQVTRFRATKA